jgi:hypothetical protein
MVFWWTERGYLGLLSTIGVVGVFGALVTFAWGDSAFDTFPWLWGVAMLLAAIASWCVGRRINGRPLRPIRGTSFRNRFFYPARNRFVSLPVETWSLPLLALGLVLGVRGLLPH